MTHLRRSHKARNKPYRPKPVRIPLVDGPTSPMRDLEMQARAGLIALESSCATVENLDQLAQACNVIYWCEQNRKRHSQLIEGGMRAIQELLDRTPRHCRVTCPPRLYAPIEIAVNELLQRLPRLSVTDLYTAMQQMRAQPGAPIAGAAR